MTAASGWPGHRPHAVLARSAGALVWHATREHDGLAVVVKQASADPRARLALEAERAVLAQADHPGVVPLLGVLPGPGLVLPFLPGGRLADRLQRRPVLTQGEAGAIVLALAGALAHLHGRGTAHGDLSPANVLFDGDGRPVLIDPAGPGRWAATPGYGPTDRGTIDARARDRHALVILGIELCGPESPLGRALAPLARPGCAIPSLDDVVAAVAAVGGAGALGAATGAPGSLAVEPPTASWGPVPPSAGDEERPGDQPPGRRARAAVARPAVVLATAVVGLALAVAGAAVVRTGSPAAACPAGDRAGRDEQTGATASRPAEQVVGDLDGDGCAEVVRWAPDQAEVRLPDGRRFAVGQPGDHLVLGDWTCDDRDRPGLYRPSSGQVFTFDRWPAPGASTTSDQVSHTGVHDGIPRVVPPTGAGCDLVAVDPP